MREDQPQFNLQIDFSRSLMKILAGQVKRYLVCICYKLEIVTFKLCFWKEILAEGKSVNQILIFRGISKLLLSK